MSRLRHVSVIVDEPAPGHYFWVLHESTDDAGVWGDLASSDLDFPTGGEAYDAGTVYPRRTQVTLPAAIPNVRRAGSKSMVPGNCWPSRSPIRQGQPLSKARASASVFPTRDASGTWSAWQPFDVSGAS
jgi:hypothetical protein